MGYRRRIYFTTEQKCEIWDRWQRGCSMSSIGRLFERGSSSIYPLLSRTGGIRPPDRRRSRLALTLVEREVISRGIAALRSIRSIARELCRPASTVSREIRRNGGPDNYRAACSDQAAWGRALRPKLCKLSGNAYLQRVISEKLVIHWSPEQIAGWLKRRYPNEEHHQVSHETIYKSLFVQARGVLKKELMQYLRTKRTIRRSRHASLKRNGLGQITDAVSIRERPACVEDRAVPGHWEGDLIAGSKNSYIATLVERHTRYVMLAKVHNKDTESVVSALIKQAHKLPGEVYKSLTWANCSNHHGARSLQTTSALHLQPILMCTSVNRKARGNVVPTRIPMVCSGNTFPRAPTCRYTPRPISTRLHVNSTNAQERHCNLKHQQTDLTNVLRRPVKVAV